MQQTEQRSLSYWLLVPSILSNLSHLYTCTAYVSGMGVTLPPRSTTNSRQTAAGVKMKQYTRTESVASMYHSIYTAATSR